MPTPRKLVKKSAPPPISETVNAGTKRSAPDEDDEIEALDAPPAMKRARTLPPLENDMIVDKIKNSMTIGAPSSPSKRKLLEEDGLVLMDTPGEKLEEEDDDVVILD
jgi:ubiquitin-like 1-activating enzyme E1 B